jgi:hypothetical protein
MKGNTFKILAEREVKYVELDIDASEEIIESLVQYGLKEIVNDRDALLNYGFIKAVENGIKKLEDEPVKMKKKTKRVRKSKNENSSD